MYNKFSIVIRHKIIHIPFVVSLLFVIAGCDEDAFVKIVDVEQGDFPPKLAVTATLDTDNGRFTLMMKEAHSLGYYKTFKSEKQDIVRDGTVRLFENDVEIFLTPGPFDLSVTDYGQQNGYYAEFTNVSAVAGRTYRLEIDIDGYDKARATAVMPDAPIVSDVVADDKHPVKKENVRYVKSLSYEWSTSYPSYQYMPFSLNITDNTSYRDFYSLQLEYYNKSKYPGDDQEYEHTEPLNISTSNLALIQDNPDVESMNIMMEGENIDLYSFDLMMLTDATFANTKARLDLYSPYNDFYIPGSFEDNSLNSESSSYAVNKYILIVRHHTQEAFRQYRSMAFQLAGLGFFTEPVFITSNMENAYGGFSLQNTMKITLYEQRLVVEEN